MQPFLTRFLAVLLTVLPWASAFLALPKVDKPEASLSSPASPNAPQLSNLSAGAANISNATRDAVPPPFHAPLELQHIQTSAPKTLASRLTVTKKLYLTYSSLQIEGA